MGRRRRDRIIGSPNISWDIVLSHTPSRVCVMSEKLQRPSLWRRHRRHSPAPGAWCWSLDRVFSDSEPPATSTSQAVEPAHSHTSPYVQEAKGRVANSADQFFLSTESASHSMFARRKKQLGPLYILPHHIVFPPMVRKRCSDKAQGSFGDYLVILTITIWSAKIKRLGGKESFSSLSLEGIGMRYNAARRLAYLRDVFQAVERRRQPTRMSLSSHQVGR